jgi:Polyketide cyclase / dehydrase and lipid transport
MVRVEGDIIIERPVDEVFDFVADESNEPKYNPRMTRADMITTGPVGVGSRFNSVVTGVGGATEMTIEFTEFDRPRRITEKVHLSNMDIQGRLVFEKVPAGTRMRWTWDLQPYGATRLLGPLVRWMGDRQEQKIWTGLKQHMESRPTTAGRGR